MIECERDEGAMGGGERGRENTFLLTRTLVVGLDPPACLSTQSNKSSSKKKNNSTGGNWRGRTIFFCASLPPSSVALAGRTSHGPRR